MATSALLIIVSIVMISVHAEPISGKLYVFGKVDMNSPAVKIDAPHSDVLEQDEFRAVGPAPNAMAVISVGHQEDGTVWRLDNPTPLYGLSVPVQNKEHQWCQVCKGVMHTVGIQCTGEAYAWGMQTRTANLDDKVLQGVFPVPIWTKSKIIQASCGQNHTILLTEDRDVLVFGDSTDDRLGIADLDVDIPLSVLHTPVKIPSLSIGSLIGDDSVCYVSAGGKSSFAVTERGDLFVWGANELGQLGLGKMSHSVSVPTLVEAPGFKACEIAAADSYTLAYDKNGNMWSWGYGEPIPQKFGNNNKTKRWFEDLDSKPVQIAAGQFHSAFLLANGSIFTLGYNRFDQLGVELGDATPKSRDADDGVEPDSPIWTSWPRHVEYLEGKNVSSVFANGNYTVAHAHMKTPMNCGCARGGRRPTKFGVPGSIPFNVPKAIPKPRHPVMPPAQGFAPVSPNMMKPRLAVNPSLPGEVDKQHPPFPFHGPPSSFSTTYTANNQKQTPELAPQVSRFIYYPQNSTEALIFKAGKTRKPRMLFGNYLTEEGYLYGDDQTSTSIPIPERTNIASAMPDFTSTSSHRLPSHATDPQVFSLSLQDVKRPISDDSEIILARQTTTLELQDKFPPVNFDEMSEGMVVNGVVMKPVDLE